MKAIIAGSRTICDLRLIEQAVAASGWRDDIAEVVSGCAAGADSLGEIWAQSALKKIARFPADWDRYGRGAGYIRNTQMAKYADVLIALWDGQSRGTQHMITTMKKLGKPVFVYLVGLSRQEGF